MLMSSVYTKVDLLDDLIIYSPIIRIYPTNISWIKLNCEIVTLTITFLNIIYFFSEKSMLL